MCVCIHKGCLTWGLLCLCLFLYLRKTSQCPFCFCSYCVCFTNGLAIAPFPPSFFPSPFSCIISMYSLVGWLKGFLAGRREEREEVRGELWQWRRVVLITPYVWTEEGGVEVFFQLINTDTILLLCVCVSPSLSFSHFPVSYSLHRQTVPLEIMCLVLTLSSGYYDRITALLSEVEFHVKTLWSIKRPESLSCCLTKLTVSYILSLAVCCKKNHLVYLWRKWVSRLKVSQVYWLLALHINNDYNSHSSLTELNAYKWNVVFQI